MFFIPGYFKILWFIRKFAGNNMVMKNKFSKREKNFLPIQLNLTQNLF